MKRRSILPLPSSFRTGDPKEPSARHQPYYHNDHPRPRTRREFLAQGFLAGTATVMSPSLFGLLGRSGGDAYAQASSCQAVGLGANRIPFIGIDLAGGASVCPRT
jgi:hypothetical protein